MCLVSFVPTSSSGFVLTSNRDEYPSRNINELKTEVIGNSKVFYPADMAGGSWIFASDNNTMLSILNGAFSNHQRIPPYRASRGQIFKSLFLFDEVSDFLRELDLNNIEPFTAVIFSNGRLLEVRWDERIKHIRRLDTTKSHVWSSCTLYDVENIKNRERKFFEFLSKEENSPQHVVNTHMHGMKDDSYNGFIMNREDRVKTLSITQIQVQGENTSMKHINLIDDKEIKRVIS